MMWRIAVLVPPSSACGSPLICTTPTKATTAFSFTPGDTGGSFFEMDQMIMPGGDAVGGPWYPAGKNWEPYVNTSRVSGISAG